MKKWNQVSRPLIFCFILMKKASQEINNIIYNNIIISVNAYLNVMFINHI